MPIDKQSIKATLEQLNSNGVEVSLPELMRYKTLARRLNLQPASAIRSAMAGTNASNFKGRGMEFDEARHYQAGDDIRSIDWRVTARTGKTHTKVYREERERPVLIYLDLAPSMYFGSRLLYKSVQALHCCAAISFSALARGDKIGCLATNQKDDIEFKPKGSNKHLLSMLNALVHYHNKNIQHFITQQGSSEPSSYDALSKLAKLAKPGTLVYILSDFSRFSENDFYAMGKLQTHCELRPVHIVDPIETSFPSLRFADNIKLSDGLTETTVNLTSKQSASEYEKKRLMWLHNIQSQFRQLNIHLKYISSAMSIDSQLKGSRAGLEIGALYEPA